MASVLALIIIFQPSQVAVKFNDTVKSFDFPNKTPSLGLPWQSSG